MLNETNTLTLGGHLRKLRNSIGISQEELAFKSGISTTYLGQIERNEKSPTVETLSKLAAALEISIVDLFKYDDTSVNTSSKLNLKPKSAVNKINAQLATMSDTQLQELLKIIKSIKKISE